MHKKTIWYSQINKKYKSKFTYNVQGVVFNGKGMWSYGNDFARSFVIFVVNNMSSSHTDDNKKKLYSIR